MKTAPQAPEAFIGGAVMRALPGLWHKNIFTILRLMGCSMYNIPSGSWLRRNVGVWQNANADVPKGK